MISSKDNPKFKGWLKLKQKKFRKQEQLFLVEGEHLVIEAIRANLVVDVLLCEGIDFDHEGSVTYLSKPLFEKLTSTMTSAGIMAVCQMVGKEIEAWNRLLLVDNVQDPGNLGTLIRSALAFGFDGIVMNETTVDVYNEKVVRATQGAMFQLPIKVTDLVHYITDLHKIGAVVYGAHLNTLAQKMENVPVSESMAFIVGNEGVGISDEIMNLCTGSIIIEMSGAVESLNVGVAGSILMQRFNGIK